jgi:hypothetical protein
MGHSRAAKQSAIKILGKKSKQWDNQTSRPSRTMYSKPIEAQYNGFRIWGTAQPVAMANRWFAVGEVLLDKRDHSVLLVDRFLDSNLDLRR